MDGVEIKVNGLQEVNAALYSYSQQLGDKVIIAALLQGARVVQRQAKALAPKRTSRLARAIVVKRSKIHSAKKGGNTIGVYLALRRGKGKKDPKDGFYGAFVEHGYKVRGKSGRTIPGRYFIRDAFTANVSAAIDVIIRSALAGAEIVKQRVGLK